MVAVQKGACTAVMMRETVSQENKFHCKLTHLHRFSFFLVKILSLLVKAKEEHSRGSALMCLKV